MDTDALRSLGLTENEIKIYLTLLKVGSTTAYDLAKRTGIYRVHVYDKLEQLMDKGLASYVLKGSKKYFQAAHPDKIKDYLDEKKRELKEKEENISKILPELVALTNLPKEDTEVEIFKGKEGLRTLLKDTVKTGEEVLLTNIDDSRFEKLIPIAMKQYFRDINKLKIKERVIALDKPKKFLYSNPMTEYRFLGEEDFPPTHTHIYGEKVAIIVWGTPVTIILIRSKIVAESYKRDFERLWSIASPENKQLEDKFKTKTSSIYKVGSLTGATSIIQAANQAQELTNSLEFKHNQEYDLIIIGAGPAGLAAAMKAKELKLNYLVLEQGIIGQTIKNYPKDHKLFKEYANNQETNKTKLWFEECYKDRLVEKWHGQAKNLNINENEQVLEIKNKINHLKIKTNKQKYKAEKVIIAMGIFAKPRFLNIEGESLEKVHHKLKDHEKTKNKHILIVGGGNSAAEAAILLSKNNDVTLSYRKAEFTRLTETNLIELNKLIKKGKVKVLFNSKLKKITEHTTILEHNHIKTEIKNDLTFILIGFNKPKEFLDKINS